MPEELAGLNCRKMIENLQLILSRQGSSRQSEESGGAPELGVSKAPSSALKASAMLADHPDDECIDISMEINMLAQKYLNPRQRTEMRAVHGGDSTNGVSLYGMHSSDLTLNTRQYMEKYGLLPGGVDSPRRGLLGASFDADSGELSGCPAATLIKSDKLMRLPDSLLDHPGVEYSGSDPDSEDSDVSSETLSNDTNFCLPPHEDGTEEESEEDDLPSAAASDSCVHVLAGYQRQPPLPVPSALMQSLSGVFASPKRRRRPRGGQGVMLLKGCEGERPRNISRAHQHRPAHEKASIRVLDLEKIRQTPKLL